MRRACSVAAVVVSIVGVACASSSTSSTGSDDGPSPAVAPDADVSPDAGAGEGEETGAAEGPVLCRPCETDGDCGSIAVCSSNGGSGQKACATLCDELNPSDCPADFRCAAAAPKPGGKGYVMGCLPSRGSCTPSPCGSTCCVWPDTSGTKCTSNADCCLGSCGSDGRCGCLAVGQICTGNVNCCSGGCDQTCKCSSKGSRCVTAKDCCSGSCDAPSHTCR